MAPKRTFLSAHSLRVEAFSPASLPAELPSLFWPPDVKCKLWIGGFADWKILLQAKKEGLATQLGKKDNNLASPIEMLKFTLQPINWDPFSLPTCADTKIHPLCPRAIWLRWLFQLQSRQNEVKDNVLMALPTGCDGLRQFAPWCSEFLCFNPPRITSSQNWIKSREGRLAHHWITPQTS